MLHFQFTCKKHKIWQNAIYIGKCQKSHFYVNCFSVYTVTKKWVSPHRLTHSKLSKQNEYGKPTFKLMLQN